MAILVSCSTVVILRQKGQTCGSRCQTQTSRMKSATFQTKRSCQQCMDDTPRRQLGQQNSIHTCMHTFNSLFSRTTCVSQHQKGKPFWILLKQEMMGGSGISWTTCKSFAPHSKQITMPVPHHSIFMGRMLFLMPNQQCQSTECRQLGQQNSIHTDIGRNRWLLRGFDDNYTSYQYHLGDRLWAGIPPQYVNKPTRSTQPCIPPGSLN